MLTCILCPNGLTADTKPERVLLNALGGRKTTQRVVAKASCDSTLGVQANIFRGFRTPLRLGESPSHPEPRGGLRRRLGGLFSGLGAEPPDVTRWVTPVQNLSQELPAKLLIIPCLPYFSPSKF